MKINNSREDTIVAISTPVGEAGISIVRLSGPRSLQIADRIFVSKNTSQPSQFEGFSIHYGWITNGKVGHRPRSRPLTKNASHPYYSIIDEVLLTVMRAPRSYTREDIVEINCHGGIVACRQVLALVIHCGARLAEPGEFTKRAFLNGRIDLVQAEAVADIICSETQASWDAALSQLRGRLSQEITGLRQDLIKILAGVEASIDFPMEEIEEEKTELTRKKLEGLIERLRDLIDSGLRARVLREGASLVICGRTNVGKSSLFNAILQEERAIVTALPGTTRDVLEGVINIEGIAVRLSDTAGFIKPQDIISRKSVERSRQAIDDADLALCVLEANYPLRAQDRLLAREISRKKSLVVINKIDLYPRIDIQEVKRLFKTKILEVSALKGTGISTLRRYLGRLLWKGKLGGADSSVVTNSRHIEALERVGRYCQQAHEGFTSCFPLELVAEHLRSGLSTLGEITGETSSEDILSEIFARFCIGK